MFEKGVPVEIHGKQYNLVFTVAAMIGIEKRYGSIEKMIAGLGITEAPDGVDEDGNEKTRQEVNQEKLFSEIPWIAALLANQGIMIETGNTKPDNPELLTEYDVPVMLMLPYQAKDLTNSIMQAIAKGNGVEHEQKNVETAILS